MPTASQKAILHVLAECEPGRGILVARPSHPTTSAFESCRPNGWVEEVTSGPLRVWKVTPAGREALATSEHHPRFRVLDAEC